MRINVNITIDIQGDTPPTASPSPNDFDLTGGQTVLELENDESIKGVSTKASGDDKFASGDEILEQLNYAKAMLQSGVVPAHQAVKDLDAINAALQGKPIFAVGDVVRLKTSKRRRVITSIDGDMCTCYWDSPKGIWHTDALEHVPGKDKNESKEEE